MTETRNDPAAVPRGVRVVLPVAVVLVSAAMTLLTLLPATRPPAMVTACVLAALAPVLGLWLYRPARRLPWFLLTAMLVAWAVSFAATTTELALDAQFVGTLVAVAVVSTLFDLHRRGPGRQRREWARTTWGRRVDQLVVLVVLALAVAQAVRTATAVDAPPSAWWSPVDVVLACLLLRFVASRAELGLSMKLFVGAGVLACVYDAVVANTGTHIVALPHPLNSLWALATTLFVAASVHPSMRQAFVPGRLRRMRSESGRVLGLVPLLLVPCVLATFDPAGRLPTSVYLVTGAVVAALTVARGAQALRTSEERARRDPLTSLANRRALQEAFDALVLGAAHTGGPIGRLVALDLDDFKNVNDTWGHETGDQLLVRVGDRLAEAVGDTGTVARSGGDEFVVLLRPGAPDVPDLLERAFLQSFVLDTGAHQQLFVVRASSGWVDLTTTSALPHALADADIALYTSKATARGTTTRFAPEQREAVLGRLALAEDLRALVCGERGAGELTLLFQPLVSLRDRRVLGCEALVRWAHPTRGLIGPDDFLPLAEVQGRGSAVDTWVLQQACTVAAGWAQQGLPWSVSVNLGRSSMVDPDLEARVRAALASTGLTADRLHLEITEHDQLPTEAGVAALRALADSGVQVSLDDFGTGYTSLAYLQRYPVSVLKLDRSVTGVDSPTALLTGVVGLADALGITVLAEGIESDEQCARLAALGADRGQGWLFGRPVPADQLPVRVDTVTRPDHGLTTA
ncbi:bifunctional diguanylate cyclase/phosphodiesterase [Modestobacter sp. Leaf380]|uniref:putative bifunctional diguanylate cyclase/phosphodiesterase n=1 Tax=Modestobacter sp. Leaf380 TaxID=1736356 RepID=UPI0012F799D1|nr:bifunctional diguanylate cyclase/phosphodiesterase [Modestobacter sp. Leaf380]